MSQVSSEPVRNLYVHVPFCAHKCSYCAFYSEASSGELINRYIEGLVRELEIVALDLKPRTVFFGGGTPFVTASRTCDGVGRMSGKPRRQPFPAKGLRPQRKNFGTPVTNPASPTYMQ